MQSFFNAPMVKSIPPKPSDKDLMDDFLFSLETNDTNAVKLLMENREYRGIIRSELEENLRINSAVKLAQKAISEEKLRAEAFSARKNGTAILSREKNSEEKLREEEIERKILQHESSSHFAQFLKGEYSVTTRVLRIFLLLKSKNRELYEFMLDALRFMPRELSTSPPLQQQATQFLAEVQDYITGSGLADNMCSFQLNFNAHLIVDFLFKLEKLVKSFGKYFPPFPIRELAIILKNRPLSYHGKNAQMADKTLEAVSALLKQAVGSNSAMRPSNRSQEVHDFCVRHARQCEQLMQLKNILSSNQECSTSTIKPS